ncbi:MAG: LLM class flavin-dependent oxidoreductase [Deltaproteobacteria bacterium]|nr:LLM class flavin-dependent oxidoreductase [Deltaproteobacteria bacterium]
MATEKKVDFGIMAHLGLMKPQVTAEKIQTYFRRAEELGFHSAWMNEQSGFRAGIGSFESMTLMSYAAALTTRLRFGFAVMLINLRNPVHVARGLASIDQLSKGRLIFGVGLGAGMDVYSAYGLSSERRVARFNETLSYIQGLWTEDDLNFEGQFFQVKNANMMPKPYQKPHPPIWFGGSAPAVLKRAVRRGSGFVGAGSSTTADFKSHVQTLRQELEAAGKDPATFPIAKRVNVAVDKDSDRALRGLREWFGDYYRNPDRANSVSVWGSPDQVVEGIQDVISAGAGLVIFSPVFDGLEQMEILASEVVPRLT